MWALLSRAGPGSRRVARSWGLLAVAVVVGMVEVGGGELGCTLALCEGLRAVCAWVSISSCECVVC